MTNNTNPASKSGKEVQHAPYLCPHCSKPCDEIAGQQQPGLVVLFHGGAEGCQKILSCFLQPVERRVVTPPLIKLQ